jgi:hypothetical protein
MLIKVSTYDLIIKLITQMNFNFVIKSSLNLIIELITHAPIVIYQHKYSLGLVNEVV